MSEYFLQVELIVHEKNQRAFEKLIKDFMTPDAQGRVGFERIHPGAMRELAYALRSTHPISYRGYRGRQSQVLECRDEVIGSSEDRRKDYYRYVHVWRIDDLKQLDLARLMTLSSDSDEYRAIDALVARETQNFVYHVPWLVSLSGLEGPMLNVVRVTRELNTRELGSYLFGLGALIPTLDAEGIRSLGYFQNVTGLLNTVTEYWNAPPNAAEVLRDLPAKTSFGSDVFARSNLPANHPGARQERRVAFLAEEFVSYLDLEQTALRLVGRRPKSRAPKPLLAMDQTKPAPAMSLPLMSPPSIRKEPPVKGHVE